MGVQIYGIQRAQAGILRAANAARVDGGLRSAVKGATVTAHRYAVSITHVDTGALKNAHAIDVRGDRGQIYISPSARRSDGRHPAQYGPHEHARGGSHAFYERTVREAGRMIGDAAMRELRRYLP